MAYGMLIDLKKCVGCQGCATACKAANGTPPGVFRSKVLRTTKGVYPTVEREIVPLLCNQCSNASCVVVCPTGATKKEENGIVTVNKDACVGCKACIMACPYDARYMTDLSTCYMGDELTPYEKYIRAQVKMVDKTVDKCDFCFGRTPQGATPEPACVDTCMVAARTFGELDEIRTLAEVEGAYQLHPEQGTQPCVFYVPNTRRR